LPLIYALNNSSRHNATQALRYVKKGASSKEISWVVDFVRDNGGIEYSLQKADEYATLARNCLDSFPDSPAKESLLHFVTFVIDRNS
jgi:octaprenyl-diphosphate synthase